MSTDQLRNSVYLHHNGAGNFKDQSNGAHAGTPSIGNTDKIRQSVATLLGTGIALTQNKSVDLDRVYGSAAHNSLGLQVAISGRAEVVQSDVAAHLGEYQDPIKSVLNVAVANAPRVIVRRRFAVGGKAEIIPERAPGRTVAVKEEEREVVMARYGADIEMNTNLFLEPEIAAADMKIKVDHQKKALEDKLTELGYECILREGSDLVRSLADATPALHGAKDKDKIMYMDQVYTRTIFGAMEKFQFPLQNLYAAAKRAAVMSADPFDTLICPAGMHDLQNYTRAENVYYYMQGQEKGSLPPIKFGLDGGMIDPTTGLRVFVSYPKVDHAHGTAYQSMEKGNLMRERTFGQGHFYNPGPDGNSKTMYIMDYHKAKLVPVSAPDPDKKSDDGSEPGTVYTEWYKKADKTKEDWAKVVAAGEVPCWIRPEIKALMSSAILAASGANTGELLMAYPQTSVNTIATSPEMMKMQLRVYLGAYLKNPSNVMVIPDCHFEGITGGGAVFDKGNFWHFFQGNNEEVQTNSRSLDFTTFKTDMTNSQLASDLGSIVNDKNPARSNVGRKETTYSPDRLLSDPKTKPLVLYQAAVFGDAVGHMLLEPNEGHLGSLDCPEGMHKLFGHNVFASGGPALHPH